MKTRTHLTADDRNSILHVNPGPGRRMSHPDGLPPLLPRTRRAAERLWRVTGCIVLAVVVLLLGAPGLVRAATGAPGVINYQGQLTGSTGGAVSSGDYHVQFKIWGSPSDPGHGNYYWGRMYVVHVATNGMFNVLLDDSGGSVVNVPAAPLSTTLAEALAQSERYLGLSIVAVNGTFVTQTNEITPRQRLASAPYALRSSSASLADNATYADGAGTANYAILARSATNFGTLTTNDFMLVSKPSQTLNGSLLINNNLVVNGNTTNNSLTVNGNTINSNLTVNGTSTLIGNSSVGGTLSVSGISTFAAALNANGGLKVAGAAPIEIRSYALPKITDNGGVAITNTGYSTAQWSAAVIGWQVYANVLGTDKGWYRARATTNASGCWDIQLKFFHQNDATDIVVDAMFIRKELVRDFR